MDQKTLRAKIAELREAAEQARALSMDLSDPEAERGFVEFARKMDAEADALERSAARTKAAPE